nr:replication initiator protein A [Peptoniphilus sp. oral taxon 386]
MLPKTLVTDETFKNLSSNAKILYSCLLERTSLSFRNKWLDEENRVYHFHCGRDYGDFRKI